METDRSCSSVEPEPEPEPQLQSYAGPQGPDQQEAFFSHLRGVPVPSLSASAVKIQCRQRVRVARLRIRANIAANRERRPAANPEATAALLAEFASDPKVLRLRQRFRDLCFVPILIDLRRRPA